MVVNLEHRKNIPGSNIKTAEVLPVFGELLDAGVERISSNDLSKKMHVTASQIRQDLNNFGDSASRDTDIM